MYALQMGRKQIRIKSIFVLFSSDNSKTEGAWHNWGSGFQMNRPPWFKQHWVLLRVVWVFSETKLFCDPCHGIQMCWIQRAAGWSITLLPTKLWNVGQMLVEVLKRLCKGLCKCLPKFHWIWGSLFWSDILAQSQFWTFCEWKWLSGNKRQPLKPSLNHDLKILHCAYHQGWAALTVTEAVHQRRRPT